MKFSIDKTQQLYMVNIHKTWFLVSNLRFYWKHKNHEYFLISGSRVLHNVWFLKVRNYVWYHNYWMISRECIYNRKIRVFRCCCWKFYPWTNHHILAVPQAAAIRDTSILLKNKDDCINMTVAALRWLNTD